MELRSYNVEKLYTQVTKLSVNAIMTIPEFDTEKLNEKADVVKDLLSQIDYPGEETRIEFLNVRKDGEIWTPYLQIVMALLQMGEALGVVKFSGMNATINI